MRQDKLSKQNVILYLCGIIPVVWLGLLIAPCLKDGLPGLVQQFGSVMQNPFQIQLCEDSVKTVLTLLLVYGIAIGVYLSTEYNYRRREEHGSAKWGTAGSVNKKYANKDKTENKLLTQNVAIGLDGRKHRRNLNVLVCGGSGAGKTRFYAKPNIMNANTSFVVLDPNETRASIHSVAASGLEVFSRSKGLMEMLSDDTLNIMDIDVNRPFILTVITPDETDVYDALSGLLVSQVSQHLIRVAQEKGGRLPIRVNIILEELGSVGKSIPSLPNLMVASRSRNMRLMLVLQSNAQLVDVYGKSKAETINSCIGITIGFSTNSWETLTEWVQRCGEKQIENSGHIIKEQLITASQLAAMPTGTALVMVDSQYKFIAHLPFYDEMYDNSKWKAPHYKPTASGRPFKSLDFEAMVKGIKKKQMESTLSGFSTERKAPEVPRGFPFFEEAQSDGPMDIDSLVSRIDAKIAELEAEEEAERKKQEAKKKYHVIITEGQNNIANIAEVIATATDESLGKAAKRLAQFPVDIAFSTKSEAVKFAKDVTNAGGKAIIKTS